MGGRPLLLLLPRRVQAAAAPGHLGGGLQAAVAAAAVFLLQRAVTMTLLFSFEGWGTTTQCVSCLHFDSARTCALTNGLTPHPH